MTCEMSSWAPAREPRRLAIDLDQAPRPLSCKVEGISFSPLEHDAAKNRLWHDHIGMDDNR